MKVKPLDVDLRLIDPAKVLDDGDKWQKIYQDIVAKQGN
jgi:hypothetical protein